MFARQYELARVDESREGALIQVVDVATPPEYKSKPKRAFIAVAATCAEPTGDRCLADRPSFWRQAAQRR